MNTVIRYFPPELVSEIKPYGSINELRLKRGARACVKKDSVNYMLTYKTTPKEFEKIVAAIL
ncbi:MAG: hypothetical protein IKU52_00090, partial [Clostridia bacterium]|nr:hypothetical protein [Clostridia bacterium]